MARRAGTLTKAGKVHGNFSSGLRFMDMQKVGDSVTVETREEYRRLCSARAYFYNWARRNWKKEVIIISERIHDENGAPIGYKFTRVM